ncbi:MAG: serine hydrolase [Magnetococcales bacterium]|nr:serine hydrolase [Magnetococcales bacterium]
MFKSVATFFIAALALFMIPSTAIVDELDDGVFTFDGELPPSLMDDTPRAQLWEHQDAALQKKLDHLVKKQMGIRKLVNRKKFAVALVDITDIENPRVATINGDEMLYAASLPKIAVLLSVFQKVSDGEVVIDNKTQHKILRMIRRSSNPDTTAMMHLVSKPYIAKVLSSPRYKLYDPMRNGGLWVGKDYGKGAAWKRDPMHNISHGATAIQVARFYYMLETGELVDEESSKIMKQILGETAINHKFKKGINMVCPTAKVYRKSGSWRQFHSDSAIIEHGDMRYIAVALAETPGGGKLLTRLIMGMNKMVLANVAKAGKNTPTCYQAKRGSAHQYYKTVSQLEKWAPLLATP